MAKPHAFMWNAEIRQTVSLSLRLGLATKLELQRSQITLQALLQIYATG